jgi:hypothetical protein
MDTFFGQNSDMHKAHNLAQASRKPPSPMPPPNKIQVSTTPKKPAPQIIKKPAPLSPKKPAASFPSPIPEPLPFAPPKQTRILQYLYVISSTI